MLNLVEASLPRGPDEWERVVVLFNERHNTDWCIDRIKGKWHQMLKVRKPTGDPSLPPHIKRAKQLRARIEERVCVGNTDAMQIEDDKEEADIGVEEPRSRPAPIEVSIDVLSPSASTSSSSSSPSSSSSSPSSNPSAYKRKRIDVDGITEVIKDAVVAQAKSTDALCAAVASQAKGFEALSQGVVQNAEMIRLMTQLLAAREGRA
jgi:hypothetical protein